MPQASSGIDFAVPKAVGTLAENTESCFSSVVLLHDGHSTVVPLRTSVSNRLLHFLHRYSNIGMALPLMFISRHCNARCRYGSVTKGGSQIEQRYQCSSAVSLLLLFWRPWRL